MSPSKITISQNIQYSDMSDDLNGGQYGGGIGRYMAKAVQASESIRAPCTDTHASYGSLALVWATARIRKVLN